MWVVDGFAALTLVFSFSSIVAIVVVSFGEPLYWRLRRLRRVRREPGSDQAKLAP